jgi:Cu/Zn superoxide dismutase
VKLDGIDRATVASEARALGGYGAIRRSGTEGTMTRLTIAGALLACVSLLAGPAYAQPKATAEIKDASGKLLGEAVLAQRDGAVEIDVTLTGLPKGTHAFHIHEVGRCDPPVRVSGRALQSRTQAARQGQPPRAASR